LGEQCGRREGEQESERWTEGLTEGQRRSLLGVGGWGCRIRIRDIGGVAWIMGFRRPHDCMA
jgi:hypothetical protein